MACPRLNTVCVKQGDTQKWRFTLREKATGLGVNLTGASFTLKLREVFNDVLGPVILDKTSGSHPSYFDVTSVASGIVYSIIPAADSATLEVDKNYLFEFKRIIGSEVFTCIDLVLSVRTSL